MSNTETTTTPAKYRGKQLTERMVPGPKKDNSRIDELVGRAVAEDTPLTAEEQVTYDRLAKKLANYNNLGKQYGKASETIYHLRLENYYLRDQLKLADFDLTYYQEQWAKARRWSWLRLWSSK